jgi:ribulose bisphosphate carboxylase small subunit
MRAIVGLASKLGLLTACLCLIAQVCVVQAVASSSTLASTTIEVPARTSASPITGPSTTTTSTAQEPETQDNATETCTASAVINNNNNDSKSSLTYQTLEAILADDYDWLDEDVLKNSVTALQSRGAHRCWHKHSTFLEHLVGVHNILRLWGQGMTIGRVGLFHSAYSNSYVNLALFDPQSERALMADLIGKEAEDLVYLFCVIDRQAVVVNTLLKQGYIPQEGLHVPHLRLADQQVYLSPEVLRMLVVFTMADTADQYFGWQDDLFGGGGEEGSMIVPGQDYPERHESTALWPGVSRPGLWMSYISQLAQVVRTFRPEWRSKNEDYNAGGDEFMPQDVPPVFDYGRESLTIQDEARARDLYWHVITNQVNGQEEVMATLRECIQYNPWAFEPRVLLAQKLLHQGLLEEARAEAKRALDLQEAWGTCWDKRMSFGAWVAWTRVLHQRASEGLSWPRNAWEVNNFGLVKG